MLSRIDPITLEVLTQALIATVREMRATICRTASSVAIYDAKDFSCGLFAPDGQVVAQSEDIGSHVVPLPWSVRSAMDKIGATLAPADVILVNDPYAGGTHLNDVTIIYPVFRDGRLIFFPAVRAHWADVGGMVPGSMSGKATDIYQEGIRIPPLKIIEGGRMNEAALELLLANMRVPEERLGDLQASLSACRVAERRIDEICTRYGVDTLREAVRLDLDRAEARMRSCIGALRDGTYCYEDYLETFIGGRFEPLLLPLALTVSGDRMVADFTGAAPQVPFPVNSTAAVSAAGVFITVKSVFDPQAPLNQGSFRPIEVITPPGTIVNVQRPAPAGSHGEIRKRVIATMVGALAQLVPDKVAGDLCRTSFHNLIGGFDIRAGREWVHYEWSAGGNGAFAEDALIELDAGRAAPLRCWVRRDPRASIGTVPGCARGSRLTQQRRGAARPASSSMSASSAKAVASAGCSLQIRRRLMAPSSNTSPSSRARRRKRAARNACRLDAVAGASMPPAVSRTSP